MLARKSMLVSRKPLSRLIQISLIILAALPCTYAQKKAKKDLFLLIGQSNMAGRGQLDSATVHFRSNKVLMIDSTNTWTIAKHPIHFDKPKAVGVGLALTFSERVAEAFPHSTIGLIPCAVGGSGISDWQPTVRHQQTGIYAYDAMMARTKAARKSGKIRAVLWHQGENDSNELRISDYEEKLITFFNNLRKELKLRKQPIIVATMADFYVAKNPVAAQANAIIKSLPSKLPNMYVVDASDLTHNGDQVHFGSASLEELGYRYADKYLQHVTIRRK